MIETIRAILQKAQIPLLGEGVCGQIDGLPCPYLVVPGEHAVTAWQRIRQETTVAWPLIVPENFNDGNLFIDHLDVIRAEIVESGSLDVPNWLMERWADYDFTHEDDDDELTGEFDSEDDLLPEDAQPQGFTIPYDIMTGIPYERLWLVMIPKIPFYQIPIYMQYGGWNACPFPAEHAALMKRWHARFGAELVGLNGDTVEMMVNRLPHNEAEAFEIAKEQMAYCDDIVFQGTMTVARLAKALAGSKTWYFWWD